MAITPHFPGQWAHCCVQLALPEPLVCGHHAFARYTPLTRQVQPTPSSLSHAHTHSRCTHTTPVGFVDLVRASDNQCTTTMPHIARRRATAVVVVVAALCALLACLATTGVAAAPTPNITWVGGDAAAATQSPTIHFLIQFSEPVTRLAAGDFRVSAGAVPVLARSLSGAGTSWQLAVTVAGGAAGGCPPGYTRGMAGGHETVCGRAVEAAGSWGTGQAACAPHGLAVANTPARMEFYASLRGSAEEAYW